MLSDVDIPAYKSLRDDNNFSKYLKDGIVKKHQQQVLNKLLLSVSFNIRNGLDDYDDDCDDGFKKIAPVDDIITADMHHQQQLPSE